MTVARISVPLHKIAHARSGDKGNRVNIGVFSYRPEDFELLREQLTEPRIRELFAHRTLVSVQRYELARLNALNFVIDGVLQGGVNASLNLDGHGKTLSFLLLSLKIEVPGDWLPE